MNFFDHNDLGNHLLQLCPKVVKHPVYIRGHKGPTKSCLSRKLCAGKNIYVYDLFNRAVSIAVYVASNGEMIGKNEFVSYLEGSGRNII
jgi:hypothetical protein